MMWIVLSAIGFVAIGFYGLSRQRANYEKAMIADNFAPHEIRKALRLFDRGGRPAMEAYCREVIERRTMAAMKYDEPVDGEPRDWSKVDSWIG